MKIDSERKQRQVAKKCAGDCVKVETIPFKFATDEKSKFILKDALWGYLEDLPSI